MKLPHFTASRLFTLLLLLTFIAATASAQQTARIRLESLDKLASKAQEVVRKEETTVDGDGKVYARCFEFKEAGEYTDTDLQEIRAQLQKPGWSLLIRVNDHDRKSQENETAEIYVFGRKSGSDVYAGMTIIATEAKELAVVNIVGQGTLGELMKKKDKAKSVK